MLQLNIFTKRESINIIFDFSVSLSFVGYVKKAGKNMVQLLVVSFVVIV